jgi:hypothetical protein
MHPAALPIELLLKEVEFRTTRGPGPGGQHRNKSDTMVRLTHKPSGIQAQAGERRSQDLNRAEAIRRLRRELALALRSPFDEGTVHAPSELWRSRVSKAHRIAVSVDDDFPTLPRRRSTWWRASMSDSPAAGTLDVTTSQLVKFLAREPAALAAVNRRRAAKGLHAFQ